MKKTLQAIAFGLVLGSAVLFFGCDGGSEMEQMEDQQPAAPEQAPQEGEEEGQEGEEEGQEGEEKQGAEKAPALPGN